MQAERTTRSQSGDKADLPLVETPDFILFARRVISAAGRRVAEGDLPALADLDGLRAELDHAIAEAVKGLRAAPNAYSWAAIGDTLGTTRQAAMQRWPDASGARRPGGQPGHLR